MVVRLGSLGGERNYTTLTWKDFKKSDYFPAFKERVVKLLEAGQEFRTPIERILKGGKYPSVAIIWTAVETDKEVVRVKLSLQKDVFKEVLKGLGIKRLNECGSAMDFVLFKDDKGISYGIDKSTLYPNGCYLDRGTYYELIASPEENAEDDLDFNF